MAEIYVPIDYTDVKSVIPPEDEIIYSTLTTCRASDIGKNKEYFWNMHVLMTNNGLAFNLPPKVNYKTTLLFFDVHNPQVNFYIPWENVVLAKRGVRTEFTIWPVKNINRVITFSVHRDKNYEDKKVFKNRASVVFEKFFPIIEPKREKLGEELYNILKQYDKLPKNKEFFKNPENRDRFDWILIKTISKRVKKGK